jgi:WAS/WASL-interacting protein
VTGVPGPAHRRATRHRPTAVIGPAAPPGRPRAARPPPAAAPRRAAKTPAQPILGQLPAAPPGPRPSPPPWAASRQRSPTDDRNPPAAVTGLPSRPAACRTTSSTWAARAAPVHPTAAPGGRSRPGRPPRRLPFPARSGDHPHGRRAGAAPHTARAGLAPPWRPHARPYRDHPCPGVSRRQSQHPASPWAAGKQLADSPTVIKPRRRSSAQCRRYARRGDLDAH